jgi:hypothetical protein
MSKHRWRLAMCGLLCACAAEEPQDPRDEPAVVPAPPDAGAPEEPVCQPEFGRAYIIDVLEFLPPGEGLDLNGDGTPDNALGLFADALNDGTAESIAAGHFNVLFDLTGWNGTATDPDVLVTIYGGTDADSPKDPTNDRMGNGRFMVDTKQFDLSCQTDARFERTTLEDGRLMAETSLWEWRWEDWGTIGIADFHVEFGFSDDFSHFTGQAGGVHTLCGLSNLYFPGRNVGLLLDFIANAVGMQPDIDRDGDGLEQVFGDGSTIARCTDGDGTVIEGSDCACDPRIADGFSMALRGSAITAHIVGVIDSHE